MSNSGDVEVKSLSFLLRRLFPLKHVESIASGKEQSLHVSGDLPESGKMNLSPDRKLMHSRLIKMVNELTY
jgi:hypothetical protein